MYFNCRLLRILANNSNRIKSFNKTWYVSAPPAYKATAAPKALVRTSSASSTCGAYGSSSSSGAYGSCPGKKGPKKALATVR